MMNGRAKTHRFLAAILLLAGGCAYPLSAICFKNSIDFHLVSYKIVIVVLGA